MKPSCSAALYAGLLIVAAQAQATIGVAGGVAPVATTLLTVTRPVYSRPASPPDDEAEINPDELGGCSGCEHGRAHRREQESPDVIPSGVVTALPNAPTVPLCLWKPGMANNHARAEQPAEQPAATAAAGEEASFCAWKPGQKPEDCGCGGELKDSDFSDSSTE